MVVAHLRRGRPRLLDCVRRSAFPSSFSLRLSSPDTVAEASSRAMQDPELVQIAVTLPENVEALTGDERIKHITFVRPPASSFSAARPSRATRASHELTLFTLSAQIGSEGIGKKVALKAAEVGTPVLLELGGKDPAVLCPSADLKYFADTWMRGVFQVRLPLSLALVSLFPRRSES